MHRFLYLLTSVFPLLGLAQDTARTQATANHATVYFGYGAELNHTAKARIGVDTRFIVIDNLSTNADINTLQISCPEDVSILSNRYSVYQPPATIAIKNAAIQRLEDSLSKWNNTITRTENLISIEKEVLAKTGILIENTVSGNGSKTVGSAEVLRLVEYYNAKIEKTRTHIFNMQQAIVQYNLQVDELRKKIVEQRSTDPAAARPVGRLVLQVLSRRAGEIPLEISYYTNQAGWTPLYDVRVNSKSNKVKLVYKATITQTTGIDWKKTKLTLSTGTPNFGVAAPVLSPWYLQLYVPELYRQLQIRGARSNVITNRIQSFKDEDLKEVIVNGYGTSLLVNPEKADTMKPGSIQDFTTLNEGQLNTNFDIDLPYDINSDGELHSVTIKDEDIVCILKNYAVPRMDREAYLLAEIADWQNLDLLPGDANIIVDETYIGKSIIDPNTTADTLNLSLGKDRRLAVKRNLVKELSSLKSSGGSHKQVFTYELTVKNNKLTDINMLLKDQYPLSTIREVEVKLDDAGEAMVNEESGVLTWKVSLKPGESRKFRFSYSVKYPKDKKIVNLK